MGGGGVKKNQYIGGNYLKRETLTVCRFMEGGLAKKREGVFFFGKGGRGGEVDTPMHTMKIIHTEESDTGVASTVLHIRSCSKIISCRGGTQFHLLKNVIFIMTTNIYSFSTSVAPDRGTFRTLPNI